MTPFTFINTINTKDDYLGSEEDLESYSPFIINRALSNTRDTVYFANEMNRFYGLDKKMQYDFFYYGIPKKKRFGKWNKDEYDKDTIDILKEYYGYSLQKAKDVLRLLNKDELKRIKSLLDRGGKK